MMALFNKRATSVAVRNAAISGFLATIVLYFFESRGLLENWQPAWLQETGLGYIVWSFLLSFFSYALSTLKSTKNGTILNT